MKLCWDRQTWVNTECRPSSDSDLFFNQIIVYTVCHSICMLRIHYCMANSLCSHFRIIIAIISGVPFFRIFLFK